MPHGLFHNNLFGMLMVHATHMNTCTMELGCIPRPWLGQNGKSPAEGPGLRVGQLGMFGVHVAYAEGHKRCDCVLGVVIMHDGYMHMWQLHPSENSEI